MTADINRLAEIARTECPDLPLIAFGHSMGSALTSLISRTTAICWLAGLCAAPWARCRGLTTTHTRR
jgi:alpha-beta hydrolase superfamily lysophospholipase